jgi:hypothetical protein
MKIKTIASGMFVVLVTSVLASSGSGEKVLKQGSWEMRYSASLAQSGTATQCIGGFVSLGFAGTTEWSMKGSASTTTPDSKRPASYLAVWMQLYQSFSDISFANMVMTGPQTAVSASVTNERKCFSEPLAANWKVVSTHKARPQPNDVDASYGDWFIQGYETR